VRIVSLHSDGEPLLNKRLEAYIEHLTLLGIYVTVSSNRSLLSDERSHRLIKAGLRMVGTDFSADPALYERLRVRVSGERRWTVFANSSLRSLDRSRFKPIFLASRDAPVSPDA
jgi:hypothetical protein